MIANVIMKKDVKFGSWIGSELDLGLKRMDPDSNSNRKDIDPDLSRIHMV